MNNVDYIITYHVFFFFFKYKINFTWKFGTIGVLLVKLNSSYFNDTIDLQHSLKAEF